MGHGRAAAAGRGGGWIGAGAGRQLAQAAVVLAQTISAIGIKRCGRIGGAPGFMDDGIGQVAQLDHLTMDGLDALNLVSVRLRLGRAGGGVRLGCGQIPA